MQTTYIRIRQTCVGRFLKILMYQTLETHKHRDLDKSVKELDNNLIPSF